MLLVRAAKEEPIETALKHSLLNGTDIGFPVPGSELKPLKTLLPSSGAISFVSDKPFGQDLEIEKFYHDAQSYLCPLVLNPKPGESIGLAFFSSAEIAQKRLEEIRYSWVIDWNHSKGLIRKSA